MNKISLLFLNTPFLYWLIPVLVAILFLLLYLLFPRRKNPRAPSNQFDELFLKIRNEIHSSVVPHFIQLTPDAESLIELAVEMWRLEQRLGKAANVLPENLKRGTDNSIMKFKRYLEKYDIEIIDYAGQKYNDGLNLEITAVEKDPSVAERMIKETVEPAIICRGRVIKKSKVILVSNEV